MYTSTSGFLLSYFFMSLVLCVCAWARALQSREITGKHFRIRNMWQGWHKMPSSSSRPSARIPRIKLSASSGYKDQTCSLNSFVRRPLHLPPFGLYCRWFMIRLSDILAISFNSFHCCIHIHQCFSNFLRSRTVLLLEERKTLEEC
jgi:hypothetical protein